MRRTLLLALVAAAALIFIALPPVAEAGRRRGRAGRRRMEVTCAQVKPQEICANAGPQAVGFRVSDGCNLCTCSERPESSTCTVKTCPKQEDLSGNPRASRRAARICERLSRKIQRKLRRYKKRAGRRGGGRGRGGRRNSQHSWPIKCFKERKLCRQRPGIAFFDGCNRCRCPAEAATAAQCETTNVCENFTGTRRQFKRECRRLGASIDGEEPRRRRRNRTREEGAASSGGFAASLRSLLLN